MVTLLIYQPFVPSVPAGVSVTAGGVVSIEREYVAGADEIVSSDAVQDMLLTPSPETRMVMLAFVVPIPVGGSDESPVPEQVILLTILLSFAVTVPVTGEVMNQPLFPSGAGKVIITVGAVASANTRIGIPMLNMKIASTINALKNFSRLFFIVLCLLLYFPSQGFNIGLIMKYAMNYFPYSRF
jgi:hypothetical protein